MEHMTKLQLNTLLQWSRQRGRNRSLAILAEEEKVSKTAIQKAMIKLEEYGYMDKDHELTEEGWAVAEAKEKQLYLLKNWRRVHHVDAREWEDTSVLLTEMGPSFIEVMTGEGLFCSICRGAAGLRSMHYFIDGRQRSPKVSDKYGPDSQQGHYMALRY